jgi:hypothetical protein
VRAWHHQHHRWERSRSNAVSRQRLVHDVAADFDVLRGLQVLSNQWTRMLIEFDEGTCIKQHLNSGRDCRSERLGETEYCAN